MKGIFQRMNLDLKLVQKQGKLQQIHDTSNQQT